MNFVEFSDKAQTFLESLFRTLDEKNIVLEKHWMIDHLCYRTSSLEQYLSFKNEFSKFSELLIESDVNGRPIATYKFSEPIKFRDWQIQVVELPAPKPGKVTVDGFEHIEVVCDESFEQIKNRYQQIQFDDSGLKKDFNQEYEMAVGQYALKFHHLSLESVIRLERNHNVYKALKNSEILKRFKHYRPLVAGTFPLGVFTETSDLDILLQSADFEITSTELIDAYGELEDFELQEIQVKNEPTLLVSFSVEGVRFEVFVQSQETVSQTAYQHFQIEERLLSLGDTDFIDTVRNLRMNEGLKTEPAFAKALELSGDAYQALLSLRNETEEALKLKLGK